MTQSVSGGGSHILKTGLAIAYTAICAVIERSTFIGFGPATAPMIAVVVLLPLILAGISYAIWWKTADEFQKSNEYKAMARAAIGGIFFLLAAKLVTYFYPAADHIPSFAVAGMALVYWINNSRRLYVDAMKA